MKRRVLLATTNQGKQREFAQVLAALDWELCGLDQFGLSAAEETGLSFIENALIKARAASSASGLPALADDSGLVVPFLQGEPGIYSARYGGEHGDGAANIRRLLERLGDTPAGQRQAYFYCALALVEHATDPTPLIALGRWDGAILSQPRGSAGFGYDPVFLPTGEQRSAAELSAAEKNAVSHRGRAVAHLIQQLTQ